MHSRHLRWTAGAGAVLATVLAVAVVAPAAAADDPPSTLEEIYAALRPENLRTQSGGTMFAPGDRPSFSFDLVNRSDGTLVVPVTDFFGTPFRLVGTQQAWVERLGPNPTIPGIAPIVTRKGHWYASGGQLVVVPFTSIEPDGRVTRSAELIHSTASFPPGAYRFHVEYKPVSGGLFDVIAAVSLDFTIVGAVDETPPTVTVPASFDVDATAPDGASVSYSATATDDADPSVTASCDPPSGSTFPIGTTSVTCTATDASGNSASATFTVHVSGAAEQVDRLVDRLGIEPLGPGASLARKLDAVRNALDDGRVGVACEIFTAFVNQAEAQSGKALTVEEAAELGAAGRRIRAVLGC